MTGRFDSRHPLVGLLDETSRLNGRLKGVFSESRRAVSLGESEMMVLNAVVEVDRAPTVAQIGRSLGHPRQIIQRAANSLMDAGLVETMPNPAHKRAPLLLPTDAGMALKRKADAIAEAIGEQLTPGLDAEDVREATRAVRAVRKQLELALRKM